MKSKKVLHGVFAAIISFGIVIGTVLSGNAPGGQAGAAENVAAFSGSPYVVLNNNVPEFTEDEITTMSYEQYGSLDGLGRCTPAMACVGIGMMPTQERDSIVSVKPTGWKQNKYPSIVDSEPPYLFNRCHLIGYQLTGENANEKNLITGTRYMNVEGMLPFENKVANYVTSTGNHVMYRVIPVFSGNNMLCDGVKIEAYSVEDAGKGIKFNVFCYNVQPGVIIDYSDGSNHADEGYVQQDQSQEFIATYDNSDTSVDRTIPSESVTEPAAESAKSSYVANKNTKKFHYPSCNSVSKMNEKNKLYFEGTRDELINQGYEPCKNCRP